MIMLLISFACILYLACFQPFILFPSTHHSILQPVLKANLRNIKAQIAQHIELEADQCIFSDNILTFHDVYLIDQLYGKFHAKKMRWHMGSDHIECEEIIEGYLQNKGLSVESTKAIYHLSNGLLEWGDQTEWTLDPEKIKNL